MITSPFTPVEIQLFCEAARLAPSNKIQIGSSLKMNLISLKKKTFNKEELDETKYHFFAS